MQVGSLVQCVHDFSPLKASYPAIDFPEDKEYLVIRNISKHPNYMLQRKGIVLLEFEEYPNTPGLCDKDQTGKDLFIEVQPPIQGLEEMLQPEMCEVPELVEVD